MSTAVNYDKCRDCDAAISVAPYPSCRVFNVRSFRSPARQHAIHTKVRLLAELSSVRERFVGERGYRTVYTIRGFRRDSVRVTGEEGVDRTYRRWRVGVQRVLEIESTIDR